MTFILTILLMFVDYRIGKLSLADYSVIILILVALMRNRKLVIKITHLYPYFLLFLSLMLSTIFNITKEYFSLTESIFSAGKICIYILGIMLIPNYIISQKINVLKIIRIFFVIAVIGGMIQYALVATLGRDSWPIYGLAGNFFGLDSETSMFNNLGMMRARSFWSEPAHYAISLSMLFILLLYQNKQKLSMVYHAVYMVGIISANSVSGYGICVGIYIIYLIQLNGVKKFLKAIIMLIGVLFAVCGLLVTNEYLNKRLMNLMSLSDHSGVVRTIGGLYFLRETPWYGCGVGNNVNFYKSLGTLNNEHLWYSGSGEFYNVILVAIITMGYVGVIGLVMFEFNILKDNKKVFTSLMLTHFGWGQLFSAPIWIFLIYYLILFHKGNKSI